MKAEKSRAAWKWDVHNGGVQNRHGFHEAAKQPNFVNHATVTFIAIRIMIGFQISRNG